MMLAALWLCASGWLPAQTFTTVFSFEGVDGSHPLGLVQATDGNLYGTTQASGGIFKITPRGTLTKLFTFNEFNNPAWLIQGTDGNFYGTMTYGGAGQGCYGGSCGTVFKITPGGTLTTLHSFDKSDGGNPAAGLIQGTEGNFYGTTEYGGAISCVDGSGIEIGCGTIFKITPSGRLTTLHSFDKTDGSVPLGSLVQGIDGNFYGPTRAGTPGPATVPSASAAERSSKSPLRARSRRCTASTARTATVPQPRWSRPLTGTSTEQLSVAGPMGMALFSR
jgi:uncharacterized repeat protein (TIGR03803 family)